MADEQTPEMTPEGEQHVNPMPKAAPKAKAKAAPKADAETALDKNQTLLVSGNVYTAH